MLVAMMAIAASLPSLIQVLLAKKTESTRPMTPKVMREFLSVTNVRSLPLPVHPRLQSSALHCTTFHALV